MNISNKYLVEAIVFLSYVLFAMAWVGGTASMSQIMANLDLTSLASASFISGAVTFAKIVGTFSAAYFAIRFGIKGAFFVSCLLVTVGLMTPYAPSYDWLLVSRFLMGLGGALMIVYFNPIVMNWFAVEERATINGLNAVAFNVGTAIVLWCMNDINALTGSWQNTLVLFSF
ncbi:MFS transporter [Psychrosphaera algicola]|uniref:MFS transporter n=2 Tax=Psychrosphaera TaxID=907197 RepID=A0ABT5FAY9_9GAMM|nr:MFS transporter [Psychrosphaera sp. G1-22]MDC2887751.1 MFS transporter [Psychrosphaera sp. G1-22]